jgi:L-threonylcarbamoyladenylate synthase
MRDDNSDKVSKPAVYSDFHHRIRGSFRVKVLIVDAHRPDPAAIEEGAAILRSGGLVAFPTETVYGLGANALDPSAIARIYEAKGRPSYNPLIAHCVGIEAARALSGCWPDEAQRLGEAFWPGPLTLVVTKDASVPDIVTAGLPTVAVRVPRHPVALALLERAGVPVAAPSANRSTELSPTTVEHVRKGLSGRIDLALDAGPTPVGIESTVVDLSGEQPVLLRPGTITLSELARVLQREVAPPPAFRGEAPRPAPGMTERHYSPRARLVLSPGGGPLERLAEEAVATGAHVGALLLDDDSCPAVRRAVRMPRDPAEYARTLYATLHEMDDAGCDVILVEEPPRQTAWSGVLDRLARAAAPG